MDTRKWFNPMQPQTLQGAVILFYFRAVFGLLSLLSGSGIALVSVAGAAAAFGIANEKKWGWYLGIVLAGLSALSSVVIFASVGFTGLINLMFDVLLLILLVHPISRSYTKLWFK